MIFSRFFILITFFFQLVVSQIIHSETVNFDDIEFIKPHIKILSVSKVGAGYVAIQNKSKFLVTVDHTIGEIGDQ